MKIKFTNIERNISKAIHNIAKEADKNHRTAYVVGGFVRDLILKRKNLDLDIVVEGDGVEFARALARKYQAACRVYGQFKTATLVLPGGLKFDVATARKETYPYSGALPVVEPAGIREDLFRRDFTINAMAVILNQDRQGELVDEFGGFGDVKKKAIRVLYSKSFIDDPTRILRAIRFEQRFDFHIEKETLDLLKDALGKNIVKNVKPPRYFDEFKKILEERDVKKCLERLSGLKGMAFLDANWSFDRDVSVLLDSTQKTAGALRKEGFRKSPLSCWLIYFMALLRKISFDKTESIVERFKLSGNDREQVLLSKFCDKTLQRLSMAQLYPHEIYHALKPLSFGVIIFFYASTANRTIHRRIRDFLTTYGSIKLTVSGNDLKRFGIEPGPRMGTILEEILNQKIDGQVKTHKDELKLAKSLYR